MLATINQGLSIFLASTSPRRHELLNQVNIKHGRLVVNIDETQSIGETPIDYIERMVDEKAKATLDVIDNPLNDCLMITADTIGVLPSGAVLQKPVDFDDAKHMWQQMSNTSHQVWTAVQVSRIGIRNNQRSLLAKQRTVVKTEVFFIALDEAMMQAYWATGEPVDKAGGYAIQGQGAAWVRAIEGSYSNVVGLPLVETIALLNAANQSI